MRVILFLMMFVLSAPAYAELVCRDSADPANPMVELFFSNADNKYVIPYSNLDEKGYALSLSAYETHKKNDSSPIEGEGASSLPKRLQTSRPSNLCWEWKIPGTYEIHFLSNTLGLVRRPPEGWAGFAGKRVPDFINVTLHDSYETIIYYKKDKGLTNYQYMQEYFLNVDDILEGAVYMEDAQIKHDNIVGHKRMIWPEYSIYFRADGAGQSPASIECIGEPSTSRAKPYSCEAVILQNGHFITMNYYAADINKGALIYLNVLDQIRSFEVEQ